jgi:hypothetical protein
MKPLHYKTIGYLSAMFLAGIVTGNVWTSTKVSTKQAESPCYSELSSMLKQRLSQELALTPDQLEKISPEICRTCSELTNIHHQTILAGWATLSNCYQNIEGILTTEQKAKLNSCESKHRNQLLVQQEMMRARDNQ